MATAFEVASSIARWALANNLLTALPPAMEAEYLAAVAPAAIDQGATTILRRRTVASIVFNDPAHSVSIYTSKRVTQKELESLPRIMGDCHIVYPHGLTNDLIEPLARAQGASFALVTGANGTTSYCCGSSISPGNEASAGTLGALVRDQAGILYGLTNNHVTGGFNHSGVGLPILAPGVVDVAPNILPPFTLGYHNRVLPYVLGTSGNVNIAENTDAAIFQIADESFVSSFQGTRYDTPTNILDPIEGMRVAKVGRTTGYVEGTIVGRELRPLRVNAGSAVNGFTAQIWFPNAFVIHGDTSEFSDSGDSGSLVVSLNADGSKSAVGLLFCGGPDSTAPGDKRTMILPISPILNRLGVTLVSGHNVAP